jgi:predicted phosphodiesterase
MRDRRQQTGSHMHPQFRSTFAFLTACALVACTQSEAKLSAEKTGDLSNEPAPREAPDARQVAACGMGQPTAEGLSSLARRPYLQNITARSAEVLFTDRTEDEVTVSVTLPDGTPVASVTATKDSGGMTSSGWQGVAAIDGLEPASLYCYELAGLTDRAGFITAPEAGKKAAVSFIVFGDSGGGTAQSALEDQMHTVPFEFVLHMGDIAYDSSTLGNLESQLFHVYSSLLRSFPLYAVEGNHDHAASLGAPFRAVFDLPHNGGSDGDERWYSFDWGDVHFVGLDTEEIGQAQADWLESDLGSNELPWVIALGHKPPFSAGMHGNNQAFVDTFVPILERHGVKLVLSGHDHDYERTQVRNGITYVVTGGGGHETRPVGSNAMTAFAEDVIHFVQVRVEGDELVLHAIDAVGREFDSAKITRAE